MKTHYDSKDNENLPESPTSRHEDSFEELARNGFSGTCKIGVASSVEAPVGIVAACAELLNRNAPAGSRVGYKVFHFGCRSDYIGRWLRSDHGPGFHIWTDFRYASEYRKKLNGGVVRVVFFKDHRPGPESGAVCARSMKIL